jgi:hypothetical protein
MIRRTTTTLVLNNNRWPSLIDNLSTKNPKIINIFEYLFQNAFLLMFELVMQILIKLEQHS